MRWGTLLSLLSFSVLSASFVVPAQATQYGLLVGVSKYPIAGGRYNLDGPRADVAAFRALLVSRYGFLPEDLVVLQDGQATRQNILESLARLVHKALPGDNILFYFSGHGTSAFDKSNWQIADMIGPNSGALVPYDLDVSSAEASGKSIIIGQRDLKPILSQLNKSAFAWVVLDSCYSENSARAIGQWSGPARAINLVRVIQESKNSENRNSGEVSGSESSFSAQSTVSVQSTVEKTESYPYSNVISFSAASRDETAEDISAETVQNGRSTIDGQPHGAFTNGLLEALSGAADTNHDGVITYDELFRSARDLVHPQRPQVLPRSGEILGRPILTAGKVTETTPPSPQKPAGASVPAGGLVKVALDGVDVALRSQIEKLKGVTIVDRSFDLLVRHEGDAVALYQGTLTLIRQYPANEKQDLINRITAEPDVQRLAKFRFPAQNFNLTLDADPAGADGRKNPDFNSALALGKKAVISASTEKSAYLLVFDIDKEGVISTLYPGPGDQEPFNQHAPATIAGVTADEPAGAELLKAFAFVEKPKGFDEFTCRSAGNGRLTCPVVLPGDPQYQRLLTMLSSGTSGRAEAHAEMRTRR